MLPFCILWLSTCYPPNVYAGATLRMFDMIKHFCLSPFVSSILVLLCRFRDWLFLLWIGKVGCKKTKIDNSVFLFETNLSFTERSVEACLLPEHPFRGCSTLWSSKLVTKLFESAMKLDKLKWHFQNSHTFTEPMAHDWISAFGFSVQSLNEGVKQVSITMRTDSLSCYTNPSLGLKWQRRSDSTCKVDRWSLLK